MKTRPQQKPGAPRPARRRTAAILAVPGLQPGPDQGGEKDEGQTQMGRQTFGRDTDPLGQAARHHPPADQPLQPAQDQQHQTAPDQPVGHGPLAEDRTRGRDPTGQEEDQRQTEDQAHPAPDQPMQPFPPEDALELAQAHPGVDLGVLRDLLVFIEGLGPLRVVQRRDRPHDRLPFGDGQTRSGQSGYASDHHHQEDDGRRGEQPHGDGAVVIWISETVHSTPDTDPDMLSLSTVTKSRPWRYDSPRPQDRVGLRQ
jgi:hypothetical protein